MNGSKDFEKLSLDINKFKLALSKNGSTQIFGTQEQWGDTFQL